MVKELLIDISKLKRRHRFSETIASSLCRGRETLSRGSEEKEIEESSRRAKLLVRHADKWFRTCDSSWSLWDQWTHDRSCPLWKRHSEQFRSVAMENETTTRGRGESTMKQRKGDAAVENGSVHRWLRLPSCGRIKEDWDRVSTGQAVVHM